MLAAVLGSLVVDPAAGPPLQSSTIALPSAIRGTVPDILENHELTFYLRNAPSGNDDFYPAFAQRFNADDKILGALPDRTERRGRKSNVLEATYPIDIDEHGDLFTGYIAALATAVDEHIVSNHALVKRIDELYQETREEDLKE